MSARKSKILKDESLLDLGYVPSTLPHRENYIQTLNHLFGTLLEKPGFTTQRAFISGGTGVGKTATAQRFGLTFQYSAKQRDINLKYVHVNCRTHENKWRIMQHICWLVDPMLQTRGFSPEEILRNLWDYLADRNMYLIICLDEIDYFTKKTGENIVYDLLSFSESVIGVQKRINFIFIARNHSFVKILDNPTRSRLGGNMFDFPPYTNNQLFDILKTRAKGAFYENVVPDEVLNFIADLGAKPPANGDARFAIELLHAAGKYAEVSEAVQILPEHVRKAQARIYPSIRTEDLMALSEQKKMLLLSIARAFKLSSELTLLPLDDTEKLYKVICEEFNVNPVGQVTLQGFLEDLQAGGFIDLKPSYQVSLSATPAEVLIEAIEDTLRKTG